MAVTVLEVEFGVGYRGLETAELQRVVATVVGARLAAARAVEAMVVAMVRVEEVMAEVAVCCLAQVLEPARHPPPSGLQVYPRPA